MNRSFYSSQRSSNLEKWTNKPSGFRVLMKNRSSHILDPLDQQLNSTAQEHKSVELENVNSPKGFPRFN